MAGGTLNQFFPGGHAGGHVRGAYAGGESAQGTVGAGVAVRADDQLAGGDQAFLRQQSVLDAHLAHVVEVGDVKATGEFPGRLAQLGGFDVLAGGVVVQYDGDLLPVEDPGEARLVKDAHGHGGRHVVAKDQIQLRLHQIPGFYAGETRVGGQDLLGHGHAHGSYSSFFAVAAQSLLTALM